MTSGTSVALMRAHLTGGSSQAADNVFVLTACVCCYQLVCIGLAQLSLVHWQVVVPWCMRGGVYAHHIRTAVPQEQAARVERYKKLLAPFILRRLKSEVATQLMSKKHIVQVRGRAGDRSVRGVCCT